MSDTRAAGGGVETCGLADTAQDCASILAEVERVVVGKRPAIELVLLGVLAAGHVLIEDLPGLGKTLLARSFAAVFGLDFTRVQFTPDMLPADLTGAPVYDPRTGEVAFRPGPIFTQLLLADEITAFAGTDPLLRHLRTRVRSPQTNGVIERFFGT